MSVRIFDIRGRTLKRDNPPIPAPLRVLNPLVHTHKGTKPLRWIQNHLRTGTIKDKTPKFFHQKSRLDSANQIGNDPLHYGMDSGMDYDSPATTYQSAPYPNYKESTPIKRVVKKTDKERVAERIRLKGTKQKKTAKYKEILEGLRKKKESGYYKEKPRPNIEDSKVLKRKGRVKKPNPLIEEQKPLPINPKETRNAKYKQEIRSTKLNVVNPETNEPYAQVNASLEDAKAIDLTKFSRKGHFKKFNPRSMAIGSVGMGDNEQSITESAYESDEDKGNILGHNLAIAPTTTTGGEGWILREGRMEHSNPMIGKLLNEESIIGNTIDIGLQPRDKPRTWEGTDSKGYSMPQKSKPKKTLDLTKRMKGRTYENRRGQAIDYDEEVGEMALNVSGKPINTDTAYNRQEQPRYKYGREIIMGKGRKDERSFFVKNELNISNCMNRGDCDPPAPTQSEFYYFSGKIVGEDNTKKYREIGAGEEGDMINQPKVAIPKYRGGKLETDYFGEGLGVYRPPPSDDVKEYVEDRPTIPQGEIDDYSHPKGSKLRTIPMEGRFNKPIQGFSSTYTDPMNRPKTYGNVEGTKGTQIRQSDTPISYSIKGKDFQSAKFKGVGFSRNEITEFNDTREIREVETIVGEVGQKSQLLRFPTKANPDTPNDLSISLAQKYNDDWDATDRDNTEQTLISRKRDFTDKDLNRLALTKGISLAPKSNRQRAEDIDESSGMNPLFRNNKKAYARGYKKFVDGKEIIDYPKGSMPSAVLTKAFTPIKYKSMKPPRETLLSRLAVGIPNEYERTSTYKESYGNTNFLSTELVDLADDLTDEEDIGY